MSIVDLKGIKISKGRLKILIAILLVVLMALSTSSTVSAASKTITNGSLLMEFQDAKSVSGRIIEYDYGDTIKIDLIYPATTDSTQYLDIRDRDNNNNLLKRYTLGELGVDNVSIPAMDYEPATNLTFRLYASASGEVLDTSQMGWTIIAEVIEPRISLSLANPTNRIARGDCVKFEGTITATSYNWTLYGPYYRSAKFTSIAANASVSGTGVIGADSMRVISYDHHINVTISTEDILRWADGTTGNYKFEVWNEAYPHTTASIGFEIKGISVSPVAKDTIKKGQNLTISGTTNIAGTNSEYDHDGKNQILIAVYNSTSAEDDDFVAGFWDDVDQDGTFSKDVTFELDWESDTTYQINVIAMSIWDDSKPTTGFVANKLWATNYEDPDYATYYDDEAVYVEVEDPEVKFEMNDTIFTRGETISFKGTSSLPPGSYVYIPVSDIEDFVEGGTYTHYSFPWGSEVIRAVVGSGGSWETENVEVKDDASIGSYTVHTKIFGPHWCELDDDAVTIKIEKQWLNASLDRHVVPQGGEIKVSGITTVSTVYFFASETNLFESTVTEKPKDYAYVAMAADMNVSVENDTFTKTFEVKNNTDTGNYLLYAYAPSSEAYIRTVEDPQEVFRFSVTEKGNTVNCDAFWDLRDPVYLAKNVVGLPGYEETCANTDFNSDGIVDLEDAIYLARHVIGVSGYGWV